MSIDLPENDSSLPVLFENQSFPSERLNSTNNRPVFYGNYTSTTNESIYDLCKILLTNSNLPLAPRWENIPETLLINSIIGFVLYVIFLVLTHIAWQSDTSDSPDRINQGLVSFLYGPRDPHDWYVIPRLEFLRRSDRHHKHNLKDNRICIPPELPLADPMSIQNASLVSLTNERSHKSADDLISPPAASKEVEKSVSSHRTLTGLASKSIKSSKTIKSAHGSNSSGHRVESLASSIVETRLPIDTDLAPMSAKPAPRRVSPGLGSSFFFPSVLVAEQQQATLLSCRLNAFFAKFFRVNETDLIYTKGIDAYEYLLFQRHLILIMFITNIFCLCLILPTHWMEGSDGATAPAAARTHINSSFQQTTIKNMDINSNHYWVHIVSSVCICVITIAVLDSYRQSTLAKADTRLSKRTLLVGNIPRSQRTRQRLAMVFREYFSSSQIESIQFVYNTSKLELLQQQLDVAIVAKNYCLYWRDRHQREIMVKPTDINLEQRCYGNCRLCSFFYVSCCFWPRESRRPGSEFYTELEQNYRKQIQLTCEKLVAEPSEYAFVTFRSYRDARYVIERLMRLKNEALGLNLAGTSRDGHLFKSLSFKELDMEQGQHKNNSSNNDSSSTSSAGSSAPSSPNMGAHNLVSSAATETPVDAYDPLDFANNPHVRSIRSPQKKKEAHMDSKSEESRILDDHSDKAKKQQHQQNATHSSSCQSSRSGRRPRRSGPIGWSMRHAPNPDNVEFDDLLNMATTSWYTIALLHVVMIVLFLFVTTPNVVLSFLERLSLLQPQLSAELSGFEGLLFNYFTILVQISTTALLPALVQLISKQIPYEDTASKNHSIMWKVYMFLVLMVIVLPSLGMTSAQAFVADEIRLKCLFPADNGAYYINYVISSMFISTVLELIKPSDILAYCFILWTGRSRADFEAGRQFISREFCVSMQYTGLMLIFSVVMTYTISCPLIAPAGLVYLIVKHAVDHYLLYHTYYTKKVDKQTQRTVEIFVRVALMLMLFQTTVAIQINTGYGYYTLASQIVFWSFMVLFLFVCFHDCTAQHSGGQLHEDSRQRRGRLEFCACFYLPRVFDDLIRSGALPQKCFTRKA